MTFGSGDSDAFVYDGNTGRMTQYAATVAALPVVSLQVTGPQQSRTYFDTDSYTVNVTGAEWRRPAGCRGLDRIGRRMMTFGPAGDVRGGSRFFGQSPFRSAFFVVDTILLGLTLCIGALELVRFWSRLPVLTAVLICGVLAGAVLFWNAALRAHSRIYGLYRSGAFEMSPMDRPLIR